ncbi:hypothetical protein ACLKA7_002200 [Drosophila subpalustris]
MFGKQVVEVCTIVTYWVLFVPSLVLWLDLKIENKPFDYFFSHSDYALYLILGYLVTYRVILYIFIKLKTFDLQLWHKLPETQAKLNLELEETKSYFETLDQVDGPPSTLLYGTGKYKRSAIPSPRPPRISPQAKLEIEMEKASPYHKPMDHMNGPQVNPLYDTLPHRKRAPATPRIPLTAQLARAPPTIKVDETEIYECPAE